MPSTRSVQLMLDTSRVYLAYTRGELDEAGVRRRLAALGYPPPMIDFALAGWRSVRSGRKPKESTL